MSAARRATRAGRNLLIALIIGGVLIVAIVVAYVAGRSSGAPSSAPTSPPAATSTATESTSDTADAAPTGCLGGQSRSNAMLLAAQKSAPNTTYGAVEVATAFYRWSYRYPAPSSADITAVRAIFVPADASKSAAALTADYRRNSNPSAGVVKDGSPFYLSTTTGRWLAQVGSAGQEQTVQIQAPFVIDGVLSATKSTTEAFKMRWADGAWRLAGVAQSDPAKLAAGGTTFTAGC